MTDRDGNLVDVLDLGDESRPRLQGNLRVPMYVEYSRDLTEADIAALSGPRGAEQPRALQRIHASHHSLARCLATGMKPGQAGLITGYSPGRISILQGDPAFQALVADYAQEAKSVFADLASRMNDLSLDAIEILQERLHANPETFTVPVLLELVKTFADRTGHGPGQEVSLRMSVDLIDRPPRESFEEWQTRRDRELGGRGSEQPLLPPSEPKKLN